MKTSDDINHRTEKSDLILREELAKDRTALAYERTFLAYIRTAAAFLAAGISMVYFFIPIIIQAIGYAFIVLAFIIFIFGIIRHRKIKQLSK
jgi:putative membrane protein